MKATSNAQHKQMDEKEEKARDICLNSAHLTITSIYEYVEGPILPRLVAWYSLYAIMRHFSAE